MNLRRPALGGLVLLAACAARPPPIPPVFDLGARSCPDQPDLLTASHLALDPESRRSVTVDVTADAPCVRLDGGPARLYHVFALPASPQPLMATVSSVPAGQTLLAPRILLLDGAGHMTRAIGPDSFLFRAGLLTALVRLRSDERMLVVMSAPDIAGRALGRLEENVQTNTVAVRGVAMNFHYGVEDNSTYRMSVTGRVRVALSYLLTARVTQ